MTGRQPSFLSSLTHHLLLWFSGQCHPSTCTPTSCMHIYLTPSTWALRQLQRSKMKVHLASFAAGHSLCPVTWPQLMACKDRAIRCCLLSPRLGATILHGNRHRGLCDTEAHLGRERSLGGKPPNEMARNSISVQKIFSSMTLGKTLKRCAAP
ncbi:unnamed protein product [Ectocarpus sp. 12 AP-2014]